MLVNTVLGLQLEQLLRIRTSLRLPEHLGSIHCPPCSQVRIVLVTHQRHLLILLLSISQLRVLSRIHFILLISGPYLQSRRRQLAVTSAMQILPLRLPLLRLHFLQGHSHQYPSIAIIAFINLVAQNLPIAISINYLC